MPNLGVGKTALVERFISNTFSADDGEYERPARPTLGASFLTKRVVDRASDAVVRLQVWDTAGQEEFRSMSRLYYQGAQAAILCYDITDEASFMDMTRWLGELKEYMEVTQMHDGAPSTPTSTHADSYQQQPPIVLHIVGTKADIVAEDPRAEQVPFERTIAYVAESLYPSSSRTMGGTTTGAATAAVGSRNTSQSFQFPNLMGRQRQQQNQPLASPQLPRNSQQPRISSLTKQSRSASDPVNFSPDLIGDAKTGDYSSWAQDVLWDCCNEVSSKNGEGIDEVFRVITRKLVEQKTRAETCPSTSSSRAGPCGGIAGSPGKLGGHLPRPMTSPAMTHAQSLLRSGFSNRNPSSNYGSIGSLNNRTRRLSDVLTSTFRAGGNGSDVERQTPIRNGHRPHLSDVATNSMDQLMSLGRSSLNLNLRGSRTENWNNRKRRSWLGIVRGYEDDEEEEDLEDEDRRLLAQTVDVTGEEAREDEGRGCCFC